MHAHTQQYKKGQTYFVSCCAQCKPCFCFNQQHSGTGDIKILTNKVREIIGILGRDFVHLFFFFLWKKLIHDEVRLRLIIHLFFLLPYHL